MADLKDSGARREFGTGAVRDMAEGKGRCDLLPLGVIAKELQSQALECIERYIRTGKTEELWLAIRWAKVFDDADIYTKLLEAAKQYEDGAKKYGDRNWEKGQPLHVFIDSGVRHYLKYLRGDTDEPHDRAFVWNMLGAIWTHENKPELIDLPFADKLTVNIGCVDKGLTLALKSAHEQLNNAAEKLGIKLPVKTCANCICRGPCANKSDTLINPFCWEED